MSDHKSSQSKNYPLDILKRLLDSPQLLPGENAKEFIQLFDSFEDYGKPESLRDYMSVHQTTVLTWDILLPIICRCIGRPRSTPGRASIWIVQRWRTGLATPPIKRVPFAKAPLQCRRERHAGSPTRRLRCRADVIRDGGHGITAQ
jgi:hypothetical protein